MLATKKLYLATGRQIHADNALLPVCGRERESVRERVCLLCVYCIRLWAMLSDQLFFGFVSLDGMAALTS